MTDFEQDSTLAEPFQRSSVLERVVDWRQYAQAGLISMEELALLQEFDKKARDVQIDMIGSERKGKQYLIALFSVLGRISAVEPLQYAIALLNELVDTSNGQALDIYIDLSKTFDVYSPLLATIRRLDSNWYLNKESSNLLRLLFCHPESNAKDEVIHTFFVWTLQELDSNELLDVMIVVGVLRKMLVAAKFRDQFAVPGLLLLEKVASHNIAPLKFQLLYEVCVCIWLCLYNKTLAATPAPTLVSTLANVARQITKEKVRRMSIASLRNLSICRENRQAMIACRVEKLVASFLSQKITDQEFSEDLQVLETVLTAEVNEMSSWDMYRTEVLSGQLDWSPVHHSERFWREHAVRFEENKWEVLNKLREILQNPDSTPTCLSVCCFDIGEFARFHPRAKQVLAEFNFKVDLMTLLTTSPNADVRKNALFSLQKIMANKLEYSGV